MSEATPNDESRTSIETTWGNREFIERWIAKGGWQGPIREMQTAMVLRMIPQPLDAPIRVLDLGAGYGALAVAVLRDRPKATALCLDASAEMLKLGRERNALGHRIEFVQASLETPDWLNSVNGSFDAVISSRALHHFTTNQRRRFMFKEIFGIVRAGGCFINADNVRAPTQTLRDRYSRARDEWLDRQGRGFRGGKNTFGEAPPAAARHQPRSPQHGHFGRGPPVAD